jgi:quercetin dioxygenase-like cupin family protein
MKIIRKSESKFVEKENGTKVNYYLFPEYELHYNEIPPRSEQDWHRHEKLSETVFIIDGELTAKWMESGKEKSEKVLTGDLIESENSSHTYKNESNNIAKFIVIKRVPKGEDNSEIFKNDKISGK